jgi:hypothetical protein
MNLEGLGGFSRNQDFQSSSNLPALAGSGLAFWAVEKRHGKVSA